MQRERFSTCWPIPPRARIPARLLRPIFSASAESLHRASGISDVLISPTPEYSSPLFSSGLEAVAFYGQLADLGAQFLDLARFVLAGATLEDARRLIFEEPSPRIYLVLVNLEFLGEFGDGRPSLHGFQNDLRFEVRINFASASRHRFIPV